MLKIRLLFIALTLCTGLSLLFTSGCKKENLAPGIEITRPFNGQEVPTMDSLLISGTLNDDVDLHELDVVVTDENGDTVFYNSPYVHGAKTYNFGVLFAPQDTGYYTATVTIYDHDLAYTQKSVHFYARNAARIILTQPVSNVTVTQPDSLRITGNVSDDKGMLYMVLSSINARSGDTASSKTILLNNSMSYNLNTFLPQPDKDTFDLKVSVVNHYNFVSTKTVRYYVQ